MAAVTHNLPSPPTAIFVYGTLMQAGTHHYLLDQAGVISVTPASIAGDLIDMGAYPGLRLSPLTNNRVHGELIKLEKLGSILKRLDEYEGPDFKRLIVEVSLDDSRSHSAWTYALAFDRDDYQVIASGRWNRATTGA